MTCSRCRHEFCWQCLSPSRGSHKCPGAPDVASFSPELQHIIKQAVEKYDKNSEEDEMPIHRRARELVEYAKAVTVSGGGAGAPDAVEAQLLQQRKGALEWSDVETSPEMGLLAAESAGANMAAHTAAVAASPAAAASSTARAQAQQPIGGTVPAALNAVLELEALHHCHAMVVARRFASMEQRSDGYAARYMEEMPMVEMPWEMAWGMEMEIGQIRLARERHVDDRLARQRQVVSRYLAPTNAQVCSCAEKDSRPPCALCYHHAYLCASLCRSRRREHPSRSARRACPSLACSHWRALIH